MTDELTKARELLREVLDGHMDHSFQCSAMDDGPPKSCDCMVGVIEAFLSKPSTPPETRPTPQPERTERRWTLEEVRDAADLAFGVHPDAIDAWWDVFSGALEESGQ